MSSTHLLAKCYRFLVDFVQKDGEVVENVPSCAVDTRIDRDGNLHVIVSSGVLLGEDGKPYRILEALAAAPLRAIVVKHLARRREGLELSEEFVCEELVCEKPSLESYSPGNFDAMQEKPLIEKAHFVGRRE